MERASGNICGWRPRFTAVNARSHDGKISRLTPGTSPEKDSGGEKANFAEAVPVSSGHAGPG
jgi:hypothetical protein